MEKTFFFVNGIVNDENSKKLMRRHVMKGKNAGKKIYRRSRLDLQATRRQTNVSDGSSRIYAERNQFDHANHADWRYLSFDRVSIQLGNIFSTFYLPVEVTPYSLEVINKCEIIKLNNASSLF